MKTPDCKPTVVGTMKALAHDPRTTSVLERLFADAHHDRYRFVSMAPMLAWDWLTGRSDDAAISARRFRDVYISIGSSGGDLLYLTARSIGARSIVEFGTSLGISTLYLAAAARDNGGGHVVGTELDPEKVRRARASIESARLMEFVTIREGDARTTLAEDPTSVDLLFLDGWKDLYLPVLELVLPRLRPGAMVVADNVTMFRAALAPYVERMQRRGDFRSTTLEIGAGVEVSVYTPQG